MSAYRVLVGKPERKRPVWKPRPRWEENIKMDLRETVWGNVDWINPAQDGDQRRDFVNTIMNFRVP
jgi:hypothetical protein